MNKLVGKAGVGQSGGPTAAINATLGGVIRGALSGAGKDCIRTLYGMKNGVEGLLAENLVDLSALFAGDEKKLLELAHTPAAALGSCRKKLPVPGADNAARQAEQNAYIIGRNSIQSIVFRAPSPLIFRREGRFFNSAAPERDAIMPLADSAAQFYILGRNSLQTHIFPRPFR